MADSSRRKAYDRTDDKAEYVKTVNLVGVPVAASVGEINQAEYGARIMHFLRSKI